MALAHTYRLGCRDNGRFLYLNKDGTLTEHAEQAREFLSLANAEEARDKHHRKAKRQGDRRKLYLMPVLE